MGTDKHPSTVHLMDLMIPNPNLPPELYAVSNHCFMMAQKIDESVQDGIEKTAGLRKLLEAKDCFVRQALVDGKN